MWSTASSNVWILLTLCVIAVHVLPVELESVFTNGSAGEPCPTKKCLDGQADCIDNSCICRDPFVLVLENGDFACYRNNNIFTEVKNDPTVINFNGETAQFPFPCRYLLASTRTTLKINKQNVGFCTCKVKSWNSKNRGKFFPGGLDFSCLIDNVETNEQLGFATRVVATAANGVSQFTEYSVPDFMEDGPWSPVPTHLDLTGAGVHVESTFDLVNNQIVYNIPECGYRITMVPYDTVLRQDQTQIPGISTAINCGYGPVFYDQDTSISTAPVRFGGTRYEDLAVPPLTVPDALLIRGFTSGVVQNQPNAAWECNEIGNQLVQCDDIELVPVLQNCFFFLDASRFSRCLNEGSDVSELLGLLQTCVASFCTPLVSCNTFQQEVIETGCQNTPRYPELADIINPNFCSP